LGSLLESLAKHFRKKLLLHILLFLWANLSNLHINRPTGCCAKNLMYAHHLKKKMEKKKHLMGTQHLEGTQTHSIKNPD